MDAYAKHDYRTTSRLLSHALWWNAFCAPFTYFTFFSCSQIQSRLLLVQGRYAEMEALLRISRAANECRVAVDGIPRHNVIANDLACTYIAQHRYVEAADLLKHVLDGKTSATIKQYAALNLALCYVKTGQIEDSAEVLRLHQRFLSKAPEALRLRVMIVQSMIDLNSKRFEEAEVKLDLTIEKARKLKESDELLAICYFNLGELRWKQDRVEEADLYYRTGVDLFKVNCEPSYWSLAEGLRDYAQMLRATGQEAECARRLREADLYESAYLEREMMRLTYLRYRVTQEKPVRMLTDLVNVDGFPPLSIELNPPDKDGFQKEVDLDEVEIEARKLEALELEERNKTGETGNQSNG
jgi:tetratricopeptide (TPR) repeat protein